MPDPKTLYSVVAVVVVGLVAWVGFVLATVKQQWAREASTELVLGTPATADDSAVFDAKVEEKKAEEEVEAKAEEKTEAKAEEKTEAKAEEKTAPTAS